MAPAFTVGSVQLRGRTHGRQQGVVDGVEAHHHLVGGVLDVEDVAALHGLHELEVGLVGAGVVGQGLEDALRLWPTWRCTWPRNRAATEWWSTPTPIDAKPGWPAPQ